MVIQNQTQIDYWNTQAGPKWVGVQQYIDRMFAPVAEALLDRAAPQAGECVLDVGCGCGDTTLMLAGYGTEVTGVDIARPMLDRARERAGNRTDVSFREADASAEPFDPVYNLVFSRFGLMFFDTPKAAFANLCRALAPGGRLVFACWQNFHDNPWLTVPYDAAKPYLPEPGEEPDPRAPGPFALADTDYIREILADAGFDNPSIELYRPTIHLGDSMDEAMAFLQELGPLSNALVELDEQTQRRALATVREVLESYVNVYGLRLDGACYLVSAQSHPAGAERMHAAM